MDGWVSSSGTSGLETVDDDAVLGFRLGHDLLLGEPLLHIAALVALQLENLSHFLIGFNTAVAVEHLLHGLANALQIQVMVETLHRGNTFSSVSLLHTNVDLAASCAASAEGISRSGAAYAEACNQKMGKG